MLIWVVVSILSPQLASAAKIPPLPPKWIYVGCLNEGNGSRIMTDVCESGPRHLNNLTDRSLGTL